jgi:flagellar biosynthesis/type III secretory pathway chaperone
MSAEKLISTMEKLLKLHKSLYEIAQKKTEIVKIGDIDALNQTLKDEQACIAAINNLENERKRIAAIMIPGTEKPTIVDCLSAMEGSSLKRLEQVRTELLDVLSQLRQRNELNQQLIYQSLQFVNLSLSLLTPQQDEFNYGPAAEQSNRPGLFNFKA